MALSLSSDAPPAVPKVSLHKDARSEVIHVWREWRHRQMLKQFKEAVDGYQTPENSDINVCERVLKAVDAVLSAETPHWLKSSEFVMRLHTSTKTLLQIRKNCSQGKWHQVVELTEHLVSREFTTRAVRYVDMCRALRLGVSMSEDPKWNLPVGTIEMLESRNFALERLFIKFYQKAIDISFVNLKNEDDTTVMVGAALSKRCGALEAVHAALEIGEKAGYVLGGDNDGNEKTSEARYAVELQTLVLLLRLRGAVAANR